MQDAESEETLYNAVYNEDSIQLPLMQAGLTNELVTPKNKHLCRLSVLGDIHGTNEALCFKRLEHETTKY